MNSHGLKIIVHDHDEYILILIGDLNKDTFECLTAKIPEVPFHLDMGLVLNIDGYSIKKLVNLSYRKKFTLWNIEYGLKTFFHYAGIDADIHHKKG